MAWEHLVGRKFARVLREPDFEITSNKSYTNDYRVLGWRFSGVRGRDYSVQLPHRHTTPEEP